MSSPQKKGKHLKPYLWLIRTIGVIVPSRLRADWKQEWQAELQHRELLLADVGSSRVDLQACKLEYSIVSPK